jgi:hypothetical protein
MTLYSQAQIRRETSVFFLFRRKERAELKAAQKEELQQLQVARRKSISSIQKNAGKAARIQKELVDDPTYRLIVAMGRKNK